jgi:hypothetical protein
MTADVTMIKMARSRSECMIPTNYCKYDVCTGMECDVWCEYEEA